MACLRWERSRLCCGDVRASGVRIDGKSRPLRNVIGDVVTDGGGVVADDETWITPSDASSSDATSLTHGGEVGKVVQRLI